MVAVSASPPRARLGPRLDHEDVSLADHGPPVFKDDRGSAHPEGKELGWDVCLNLELIVLGRLGVDQRLEFSELHGQSPASAEPGSTFPSKTSRSSFFLTPTVIGERLMVLPGSHAFTSKSSKRVG